MDYYYPDLDFDDLSKAYRIATNHYIDVSRKVKSRFDTNKEELRWYHFILYASEKYNVQYCPYVFTGKLSKILAGSLMVGNNSFVVGYNASPNVNSGRQNFTRLHETHHMMFDVPEGYGGQSFSDIMKNNTYSPEEQYQEAICNYFASISQIPTLPMLKKLSNSNDIEMDFSHDFESSYGANWVRIRDFLVYRAGLNFESARSMIDNYIFCIHSGSKNSGLKNIANGLVRQIEADPTILESF